MQPINAKQLHEMMHAKPGMPVVDVLAHEVHAKGHIPGSVNVPLADGEFLDKVTGLAAGKEKPVVVYCKNKDCDASPKAAKQLEEAGFQTVYDFEGGMDEWKDAGYSLAGS